MNDCGEPNRDSTNEHLVWKDRSSLSNASHSVVAAGGMLLFLGVIAAKGFGFLRQFIIIRLLDPEQYGIIALCLAIINFAISLGIMGLHQGSQRFIAYSLAKGDYDRLKGTIISTLRFAALSNMMIVAGIISLTGLLAKLFSVQELRGMLLLFAPCIPLGTALALTTYFSLGLQRPEIKLFGQDFGFGLFSALFIFLLLLAKRSAYVVPLAFAMAYSPPLFFSCIYLAKAAPFSWKSQKAVLNGKELILFSIPLFSVNILSQIMANTDTFMIGIFMTPEKVGYYNAAFLMMQLLPVFLGAFSDIYMSVSTGLVAKNARQEVLRLYRSVTKWLFAMTMPLFLTMAMFPSQVLSLFFKPEYSEAATVLSVLAAGEFIHTFLGPNDQSLVAFGYSRVLLYSFSVSACANIILNYLLIPWIGILGAAIATTSSLVLVNIINSIYLFLRQRIHPLRRQYVLPVCISMAACVALYPVIKRLMGISIWFIFTCYPVFLATVVSAFVLTGNLSEEDRRLWEMVRKRLGRR